MKKRKTQVDLLQGIYFSLIHNVKFKNELMDLCKKIKQRSIDNSYFMIFYMLLKESLFLAIKEKNTLFNKSTLSLYNDY